jgi:hypothetical protein
MAVDHAVLIPSANNVPNPAGTLQYTDQPGSTQTNPLLCGYPCTVAGHTDTVGLLYVDPATITDENYDSSLPGGGFSLTDAENNDPNFGSVAFTYV